MLQTMRTIILLIGWPVLVGGSIYILMKGQKVYSMVKGSLVGSLVRVLVFSMLIEMYSLGIVSTALMLVDLSYTYVVLPIFMIWFVSFVATIRTLMSWENEERKMRAAVESQPK